MLEATILLFKEEKPAFADEVEGQMCPLSRASLRYLYMANLSWLERERVEPSMRWASTRYQFNSAVIRSRGQCDSLGFTEDFMEVHVLQENLDN